MNCGEVHDVGKNIADMKSQALKVST
uniref:Uncharacterized protein n=1 Tax=Tetranychus urticae TaxID=32264 RepID=T1KE08_TETUR